MISRAILAGACLLVASCHPMPARDTPARPPVAVGNAPEANLEKGCVSDYRPGVDYFPSKSAFTDSAQLKVSYHGNWKRVTFTPAVDTRETLTFVLVQCGTPAPPLGPKDTLVEIPLRNFATANGSMLGAVVLLKLEDRLMGVPSTMSLSLPTLRARADNGEIIPIYAAGHGNGEQAAGLGADLFFTFYSAYPDANIHPLLKRMGAVAAPQSDHTEPTPLGRAEWIKYLALFFNQEAQANRIFADRKARYQALAAQMKDVATRPLVQLGYPETRDQWGQAGGRNQLYRMVEDAGGRHAWHDNNNSGSLTYQPMERLFDRAADADIWLGSFMPGPANMADLRREFPRFLWFKPFRTNAVYWLDANKTEGARNPWSDQGMTEPQDALADMISILHPQKFNAAGSPRFIRHVPGERP